MGRHLGNVIVHGHEVDVPLVCPEPWDNVRVWSYSDLSSVAAKLKQAGNLNNTCFSSVTAFKYA